MLRGTSIVSSFFPTFVAETNPFPFILDSIAPVEMPFKHHISSIAGKVLSFLSCPAYKQFLTNDFINCVGL